MKNIIYVFSFLCLLGCSDSSENGKWSQADMDKCVSQMQESLGKFDWDEVVVVIVTGKLRKLCFS